MTTINLHCKCLTIDKSVIIDVTRYQTLYTPILSLLVVVRDYFMMMVLDTFVLLVRRRFKLSCNSSL